MGMRTYRCATVSSSPSGWLGTAQVRRVLVVVYRRWIAGADASPSSCTSEGVAVSAGRNTSA
jgi:hypothetical protein